MEQLTVTVRSNQTFGRKQQEVEEAIFEEIMADNSPGLLKIPIWKTQ